MSNNILDSAKEDWYFVKKQELTNIKELWGDINLYYKNKEILSKRFELLNQLYLIYPEIELQAESLKGWRSQLFGFHSDLIEISPIIHYRILPNEIVFEVDKKDKNEVKKIIKALLHLNAKPFVGFSGNRGYHVHIIISPPNGDVEGFVNCPEAKSFTQTFFDILLNLLKDYRVNIEVIDVGVMRSQAHTIRSFYSINPKGKKWKTPVFGKKYEIWQLTKTLYSRVLEEMRERKEMEKLEEKLKFMDYTKKGNWRTRKIRKIWWIEKILANPNKVTDGRRRLMMYVIIPYLLNVKKLPSEKVKEICEEWVRKTNRDDNGLKYLIKSEIKSYQNSGILPMAKEKFFETFKDLRFLVEILK